jgi:GTP-binding protein Era
VTESPLLPGTAPGGFHSGFAALVGRPNVGKSTLLNALMGQKLSIVTPRPQTTRHRILGILNVPNAQVAFVDTPGLHHHASRALNKAMNRTAASALADADLVVQVIEALRWTDEDDLVLERIQQASRPAILAVNKVDKVRPRDRLLPFMKEMTHRHTYLEIVPISALKSQQVAELAKVIVTHLPEGAALFPEGEVTDKSDAFRIAETIREKLMLELNQEVPYGIAVELERVSETEDGRLEVDAAIWVDREGQKPIVIGAAGVRLKRVGRSSRLALNGQLGRRLHLNLWVKVRENWADNARALQELGLS